MANTKITTSVISADAITGALIADDVVLGGNPTTSTQSAGNNTTRIATTAFVTTAIDNLVDSAPGTMNTLNEIAAALNDDANFNTTVTNLIAAKAPLASPSFTGDVGIGETSPDVSLHISEGGEPPAEGMLILEANSSSRQLRIQPPTNSDNGWIDYRGGNLLFLDDGTEVARFQGSTAFSVSNKIGIGTTSPIAPLHVSGNAVIETGSPDLYLATTSASHTNWRIAAQEVVNQGFEIASGTTSAGSNAVDDTYTTRLTIKNDGKVGIGTTSPASLLHLKSTATGATPSLIFENTNNAQEMNIDYYNNSGSVQSRIRYSEGPGSFEILPNASANAAMILLYNGSVGIGNTNPGGMHSNANKLVVGTGSGDQGMSVYAGTSVGRYAFARALGNNTDAYDGGISYNGDRDLSFHTNAGSTRMTIDGTGKVGIGTTSPETILDIKGGGYNSILIGSNRSDNTNKTAGISAYMYTNNQVSLFQMFNQNGNNALYYGSADSSYRGLQNHYFYTNSDYNATSSHKLRYNMSGNGSHKWYGDHQGDSIGHFVFSNQNGADSSSTNCTLMVRNGGIQVQIMPWSTLGARVGTRGGGWAQTSTNACYLTSNDASNIVLNTNGSPTLASGTAISSDERLKKNITDIADGQLAKINALKPRNFEWKDERKEGAQEGFIAQEVESVMPEAVEERTSAPDPDDTSRDFEGDIKVLKHEVINARLIKAVQELSAKLEAAEARITTLEG